MVGSKFKLLYNLFQKGECRKVFFGEFDYQIDAKNRFRIPAKLKEVVASGGFLTKGTNGCLFILSKDKFEKLAEKFSDVSLFDQRAMLENRLFFSSTSEIEQDGQGRILLAKNLLEFAEIKKDIVFIGAGDYVELWAKEKYEAYSKNYAEIAGVKVKK